MSGRQAFRYAREYLLDGYGMNVPAALALWLERNTNVANVRRAVRGQDRAVDEFLTALRAAAMSQANVPTSVPASVDGTSLPANAELARLSTGGELSAAEAAAVIGISDHGVRVAIRTKRLPATKTAGRWQIRREDASAFKRRGAA